MLLVLQPAAGAPERGEGGARGRAAGAALPDQGHQRAAEGSPAAGGLLDSQVRNPPQRGRGYSPPRVHRDRWLAPPVKANASVVVVMIIWRVKCLFFDPIRCIDIQQSNEGERTQALRLVRKVRLKPP